MRIKCFSEARGVFEEGQISFEPQMYCFGGGGGGGNSDTDQAIAEQEAYDAAGGSPSQNFSSGGGGGGNDNDGSSGGRVSYDVDEDAPVGRNSGSGGRGGNDNDSSRQAIAARAGVPAGTLVGSGPKGSGVVTSAGGLVTSARGLTQAARDLGISEDEVQARINAAGIAVLGPRAGGSSAASALDQAIAEQEAYDAAGTAVPAEFDILDTPEFQAEFDAFNSFQKMLAGGVDTRTFAEKVAAGEIPEDVFVYGASAPSGDEILTFGLDDFNTGITPNPIESQISIANALKNLDLQAEEEQIFTPINMQLPGFIGAGINLIGGALNAAQKYGGGNIPGYAQDVMNRPGGAPIMANAPMMSPAQPSAFLEALMAGSDRQPVGPYSEAEGVPDVLGGFGPNQLSFLPGEPDNIYVGDPRGIEQAQMLDPNVQVLDENYFSQGQELSDRGGDDRGGDQAAPPALTLPDPVTQECPEGYTRDGSGVCVYEGRAMALKPFSASRGPRDFQYTGVGSLQPFILQPTPVRQADPVDPFALMRS